MASAQNSANQPEQVGTPATGSPIQNGGMNSLEASGGTSATGTSVENGSNSLEASGGMPATGTPIENESLNSCEEEIISICREGDKDKWNFMSNFTQSEFGKFLQIKPNSTDYLMMVYRVFYTKDEERKIYLTAEGRPLVQMKNEFNSLHSDKRREAEVEIENLMAQARTKQHPLEFLPEFQKMEIYPFLLREVGFLRLISDIKKAFEVPPERMKEFLNSDGRGLLDAVIKFKELKERETQKAVEEIQNLVAKARAYSNPEMYFPVFAQTEIYAFLNNEMGAVKMVTVVSKTFKVPPEGLKEFLKVDGSELLEAVIKFQKRVLYKRTQTQQEDAAVPAKRPLTETTNQQNVSEATTSTPPQTAQMSQPPDPMLEELMNQITGASMDNADGNFAAVKNFIRRVGGERVVRELGENQTPLAAAAETGDYEEVSRLIQEGADVNGVHPEDVYRMTPLMMAAVSNNKEIAKLLIDKGAIVNKLEYCHASALHYASRRGYIEVVRLLLEKKANIHIKDCEGFKPAHAARDGLGRYLPSFMKPNMDERQEIMDLFENIIFSNGENMAAQENSQDTAELSDSLEQERRTQWFVLRRSPLYDADVKLMTNVFQAMRSSNYFRDSSNLKL